jgi:transcriptional regulator with XRE-family HTH domain
MKDTARPLTPPSSIEDDAPASGAGHDSVLTLVRPASRGLQDLGQRVRSLRKANDYSIETLSQLSGVSKSMISKIERGEASPSTVILAKVAEALAVTFSEMMAPRQDSEVILLPLERQPILSDPETGHMRRCLAPILPARGIDWVMNVLPPGASTGNFVAHRRGVEEYIHVLQGRLRATLDGVGYELNEGDALYFQAHVPHEFKNFGIGPCTYYLIINSQRIR